MVSDDVDEDSHQKKRKKAEHSRLLPMMDLPFSSMLFHSSGDGKAWWFRCYKMNGEGGLRKILLKL